MRAGGMRSAAALLALAAAAAALLGGAAEASLARLQTFRKQCFPAIPCVMILDKDGSYGCGQCTEDTVSEEVSEILQGEALINFLEGASVRRFLLIPQILFFKPEFLNDLQFKFHNIAGIIVYDGFPGDRDKLAGEDAATPDAISTDRVNPNEQFSLPREAPKTPKFEYNNNSGGVASPAQFAFYPFNIFRVNATVASRIRERVLRFAPPARDASSVGTDSTTGMVTNGRRGGMSPTYVLQSNGKMYACPTDAKEQVQLAAGEVSQTPAGFRLSNSAKCLEERTCLPIGGQSVWSSLGELALPTKREVLAVTAPMDSTAFFHDIAQGAAAEIASLATLMAVAEAVGAYQRGAGKGKVMVRQPVYFAWNAQSWGFAGSSRFLKDVLDFECETEADASQMLVGCVKPYKANLRFQAFKDADWAVLNLNSLIDPGPLTGQKDNATDGEEPRAFFMHGQTENGTSTNNSKIIREALKGVFGVNISSADIPYRPPDASQSFALLSDVESVSLANYKKAFTNRVYHSEFDNVSRIPVTRRQPLYAAADGVARAVIRLCFGDEPKRVDVRPATIDGFIECLTSNWSSTDCELSRLYQGETVFKFGTEAVRSGNYPGPFVPRSRMLDQNPSSHYKTDLVYRFLSYHNRFDEGPACERRTDCNEYAKRLNENANNQSSLRIADCVLGSCVASETYYHDAYGTGIDTTDAYGAKKTDKNVNDPQYKVNAAGLNPGEVQPQVPQYTESYWDGELGVCGLTEDSSLFGYSIMFGGVGINLVSFISAWFLGRSLRPKKPNADSEDLEEEQVPIAV
jgi:hypothetical protein